MKENLRKFFVLIATPILPVVIFVLARFGSHFNTIYNSSGTFPKIYQILYMLCFAIAGAIFTAEFWVCGQAKKSKPVIRCCVIAEKVLIVILLTLFITPIASGIGYGKEIFGVFAGFELACAVWLLINPHETRAEINNK